MRTFLYALSILAVVGLAFWAYREGYDTRATERAVAKLEREIGRRHHALSMLRAEWAYLNRPDRLHELAEMNFERLGLAPLSAAHFATAEEVGYPPPKRNRTARRPTPSNGPKPGDMVDDVLIMNHAYGADAAPRVIAPPSLARDGEQLP